ncbi:NIPSNAP family protein [Agromyces sp. ZXT2-6]|uniref:NIPSNAP family protein n=1 Tax=Agromyces sp. ZXT2-6 TaxID=3461153 RepID=UPI004054BEB9
MPNTPMQEVRMITVHLRYEIDPEKVAEFREYGRRWIRLIGRFGGRHHGYFLPSEGDSDEAFALFSFPSLAEYERYRVEAADDPECLDAYRFATETKCIRRYERRFLSPVFD